MAPQSALCRSSLFWEVVMAGFGFTSDPDDNRNPDDKNDSSSNNPFGMGNFGDIFQQFSGMGLNLQGLLASLSGQSSPSALSQQMIRDISRKYLSAHGETPVSVQELVAIQEAFNIADLWINDATTFPTLVIPDSCALSRRDWIDSTLKGWEELTKPLVDGMSQAMSEMLKETLGGENAEDGVQGLSIPGLGNMNISQSVYEFSHKHPTRSDHWKSLYNRDWRKRCCASPHISDPPTVDSTECRPMGQGSRDSRD
jgi:hypothetical protein